MGAEPHLEDDGILGGPRRCEVLHVPTALVVERGPPGLVRPVPLDDVVPIEEVVLWPGPPQGQEVTCLLHLLHQDVPGPLGYHAHVHVAWEGPTSELRVNGGPTVAAASRPASRLPDKLPLIFNSGWASAPGRVKEARVCVGARVFVKKREKGKERETVCVCVCVCVCRSV